MRTENKSCNFLKSLGSYLLNIYFGYKAVEEENCNQNLKGASVQRYRDVAYLWSKFIWS